MKDVLIISGKGGTGKTSITAALAALYSDIVVADCDVDAPDLHILLKPEIDKKYVFLGGKLALIAEDKCIKCGRCLEICQFSAISKDIKIDKFACEGCSVCSWNCPVDAISMIQKDAGFYYISKVKSGNMVHALLEPGEENSGKLVSQVKREAKKLAENKKLCLVDGPPGIGCPVIASLSGVDLAIIVTEPTKSGMHDMKRVLETAKHFNVMTKVVINKSNLNIENSNNIKEYLKEIEVEIIAEIPFSHDFVDALNNGKTIVDFAPESNSAQLIRDIKKILDSEVI